MDALEVRCRADAEMAESLLEHPHVKRVVEWLERERDRGPAGTRRHLLATSVRLTSSMAPDLHRLADRCRERLGVETPLELYVYSSPSFNAAAVKPEDGRLFVMFSSALLEGFRDAELGFVMGHELGHHLYNHHAVPIGFVLKGKERPAPDLALKLFAWSRYAEISADRAGALCAGDLEAESRALFRLASGLTGDVVRFSLDDFLAQVDDMQVGKADPARGAPMEDWFSTHPFSPLRVKALALFARSALAVDGGVPVEQLEAQVQTLMALMEPSYLEERSDAAEAMRRVLFAGAIAIADATDGISDAEIAAFEAFFGKGTFSDRLDVERIKSELDERLRSVRDTASHPRRIQLVRDLAIIARTEQPVTDEETAVLERIARSLEVGRPLVNEVLNGPVDLD